MLNRKVYQELASLVQARENCRKSGNTEWHERHGEAITAIMDGAPSGAGIDNGTKIDLERSTSERLVLTFSYHHMNESGMYDGWTEHTLFVRPSLAFGIDLRITGPDRNDVKEYLHDVYREWLMQDAPTAVK